MTSSNEEYRKGYEVGYFYGRQDELNRKPYDTRTIGERETAVEDVETKEDVNER